MSTARVSGRGVRPRRILVALSCVAVAVTFVLGTFGWFVSAFGIGSDCTDKFSCGSS